MAVGPSHTCFLAPGRCLFLLSNQHSLSRFPLSRPSSFSLLLEETSTSFAIPRRESRPGTWIDRTLHRLRKPADPEIFISFYARPSHLSRLRFVGLLVVGVVGLKEALSLGVRFSISKCKSFRVVSFPVFRSVADSILQPNRQRPSPSSYQRTRKRSLNKE